MATLTELVSTANDLWKQITKTDEKRDQLCVTLGLTLREAKQRKPKSETWEAFVKIHFNFGRSRADELIQIAEGRTTPEKVRSNNSTKMKKNRATKPPSRDGGKSKTAGDTNVIKGNFKPKADACDEMPDVETPPGTSPSEQRRFNFLYRASQAIGYGKENGFEEASAQEITKSILGAAREAAAVWSDLVSDLERRSRAERKIAQ